MKILIFFVLTVFWCSTECSHPHPLDPPTPSELNLVRTIVRKAYPTSSTAHNNLTFQYVGLDEPEKSIILSWLSSNQKDKTKTLTPRQFYVIARFQKQSIEMIVDLPTRSILGTKVYEGMLTFDEQAIASELPFSYGPFKESVRKRGLNISQVICGDFSVGWFGEAKTRRILKIKCFYTNGTANFYARPLEGITAVVDLDDMKIVGYTDRFIAPVPKAEGTEYRASKLKPPFGPNLKGIALKQHGGPI